MAFLSRMWAGFKQLYLNTKEAQAIKRRIRAGECVSRREHRFVLTNRSDLSRGVPLLLSYKIPILGKVITLLIVMFAPWLLPSTFKFLKPEVPWRMRLEGAESYRRVVLSRLPDPPALDLSRPISTNEAVRIVETFRSKLDLSILRNGQLAALNVAVNQWGWGLSWQLRRRFRAHMKEIVQDDTLIRLEGVQSLDEEELEQACNERGLHLAAMDPDTMRAQLSAYLSFSKQHPDLVEPLLIYHHGYLHHLGHVRHVQHWPLHMLPPKGSVPEYQFRK